MMNRSYSRAGHAAEVHAGFFGIRLRRWTPPAPAFSERKLTFLASNRWGQSSLLLTPVDDPTFYIISGKSYVAGQTLTSTPTTASSLSLSFTAPITDLTSPPWIESTSSPSGPLSSYGSALALSSATALFFGGDATGDATEVVQSGNDSSWLLSYPTSGSQNWTHETAGWGGQPMRRQLAYAASATNGTVSRAWVFGGLRSDGSGVGMSELWEVQLGVGKGGLVSGGVWEQWAASGTASAPPAMWDGQAVLVPSTTTGGLPSIYLIGGVQFLDGVTSLVSMSSIWVFTPSDSLGTGSWRQVSVADAPEARRGHVAVEVGNGKIWIQGGRTLDGSAVRSDSAILDTSTRTWTTAAVGEAVWGHSAVSIGETVVMAFGEFGSTLSLLRTL
ncbi:hypothetical protein BCR35DRAFT_112730 [Leucosporidium creatinivorum]|uniref:Kelch repeat protein n=1 Tax=Leucosporidium creatinivorum TaxID=106004 RepID=A0A1Y2F137_9BASI|nr:hypothetical protein BCR35DRAFT_112730 [Leucosporidium creatinivorum]